MFHFVYSPDHVQDLAKQNIDGRMTDEQFVVAEINRFKMSKRFKDMTDGDKYYEGKQDILHKKRTAIGADGTLTEIENLPNNKIVDNQYKKMVKQKTNYLVGKPFLLQSDDKNFVEALKPYILTKAFMKKLKTVAKDALNCGIAWLFPCYDEKGNLFLKRFKPYEIIPEWSDADHTMLEAAIRFYEVVSYEGIQEKIITKVEVFNADGMYYFELTNGGQLIPEEPYFQPYFTIMDTDGVPIGYSWDKIPLVSFKYNEEEIPLVCMCKGLQDGLNKIESMWEDQMEEDPRNTILVLVNYDGENLGEFRRNLAQYGAVKVRSSEGGNGDVKTLSVTVNADNYVKIKEEFKKAIIENCMGYDAKDDRLGGNPNEMNIKSMYSDIDLDTDGMETEFQASFEELIWFLICHLANTGKGDFEGVDYDIIFNRDTMISESSLIQDCKNSVGIISDETIIAQHPWVIDPQEEMDRIAKKKEENINLYGNFGREISENNEDDQEEDNEE